MINEGRKRLGHDLSDQEAAARMERISRRVLRASSRDQGACSATQLRMELTDALLICHDLFMLGLISEAPTLRWGIPAAESALSAWSISVIPDGTLPDDRVPAARPRAARL